MKAVVLVGGFGTRLRPLTLSTPKQMLPVVDRPMIEWVMQQLAAHGVTEAVLSMGYRPEAFADAYADGTCAGVELSYAVEPEPLDTAGAVAFAAREAGIDERFLVLNGDVLTDLDVGGLADFHNASGAEGTIHLIPVEDPSRFGVVPVQNDGRVIEFVEKPPRDEAPTNWINAGTYVLEPSVLNRIPDGVPTSIERVVFPEMAEEGCLYAWQSDTYWIDTGTPESYLQAQVDLVSGVRSVRPQATADSAWIDPAAVVTDSVVMSGATVAGGALVERSLVLPDAVVAANAHVVDSIVGPRASVGTGARLADMAVLGEDVVVADGEVLTSERRPKSE